VSWLKKLMGSSEGGPAGGSLSGERVLVADASLTIQKVIELTLASEGCSVSFAATGDESVAALQAKPTLVLAAEILPGKSGLEVCEAVRRRSDLAGTIVILTRGAFETGPDEARVRMAGADGTLIKPFEPAALIEQVRSLRQKRPALP
jgi:DNA-binding response OmpR family regulator